MTKVVARFYVQSIQKNAGDSGQVTLSAVTSKENARWSQYTPSGSISMALTRKASGARSTFEQMVGKECLVTFDFDAPPREEPGRAQDAEGKDIGYASDEVPDEIALE